MIIGVDVGGTFTDVVLADPDQGLWTTKAVTTPQDHSIGIQNGVADVLQNAGAEPGQIERFILGSTVATNAVIEHKGAVTAVLTTEGFEDSLEIGRQMRSELYDLFIEAETPTFLSPRRLRVGIPERVNAKGEVLTPLDEDSVRRAAADLIERFQIEAVAVCYLFSFLNPDHERRTKEILKEEFPGLAVSISSEVDPVFREYERLCVTALDAYLRPIVKGHMEMLSENLERTGIAAELEVMQSRGGICTFRHIVEQPARTVLSGPAAGVLGAVSVAVQTGFKDIVSLDMGGTSADISVVKDSRLLTTTDGKILSYPFRFPMVDVSAIGAGGGSIAWVDSVGSLHVGPESAGADPGPCCYGRGGTAPTVTDASVVLGYLNPSYFAAGSLNLDVDAAHRAVERIGEPLGLSVPEAAWAIHAIVNAKMADEIRLWTVCRGYDPRDFALVLLGGAGPMNGGMLAKSLSISTILVPITPGVLSAFGLLVANIEHDNSASFKMSEDQVTAEALRRVYEDLDRRGIESMEKDRVPAEEVRVMRSADIRYLGQSYELNVPLEDEVDGETAGRLVRDFHSKHHQVYSQSSTEAPVEFVNLRTVHWYPLQKPEVLRPKGGEAWADAQKESRRAYFFPDHAEGVEMPVYDRARLPVDLEQQGPLVIEQRDTTTVAYPGQSCRMDPAGNIIVTNPLEKR